MKKNSVSATIVKTSKAFSQLSTPSGDIASRETAARERSAPCRRARAMPAVLPGRGARKKRPRAAIGSARRADKAEKTTARKTAYVKKLTSARSLGGTKKST